jgi:tetratricopeptide (TPR) repeat protein
MAILRECENCGNSSWFETWRKVGCPKCGLAMSYLADGVLGYSKTERADSGKIKEALAAIARGDKESAHRLLEEIIANVPTDYVSSYHQDGQFFIKCWEQEEYVAYLQAMKQGQVPSEDKVVWVRSVYPHAYYLLAFLEFQAGNKEQAGACLTLSLSLEPDQAKALAYIKRLGSSVKKTEVPDVLVTLEAVKKLIENEASGTAPTVSKPSQGHPAKLPEIARKRSLEFQNHVATLYSFFPIPVPAVPYKPRILCFYVVEVKKKDSGDPVLYLTAETNPADLSENYPPFLCIYQSLYGGHENCGAHENWTDVEKFWDRAVEIIKTRLDDREAPPRKWWQVWR